MFWADSRLLEVVKIESWSQIEVGQCRLLFFGWGVGSLLERKNHEIISLTFRTNEVEEVEVQLFKFIDLHKLQIKLRQLKVEVY